MGVDKSILPHEDKERDVAYEHAHVAHLNIFKPYHGKEDKGVRIKGEYCSLTDRHNNTQIEVLMPNQLSIKDEDVLLAIYSLARPMHHTLEVATKDDFYALLPNRHKPNTISTVISRYELLKELGRDTGGKSYKELQSSLKRIAETSISYKNKKYEGTTHLLSFCKFSETELAVTLNPISAIILLGTKAPYVRYIREDRMKLPDGIPRRIHSIFSASLHKGKGSIGLYPLATKIHGKSLNPDKIKRLKLGVDKLNTLDKWRVSMRGRGKRTIVYFSCKT